MAGGKYTDVETMKEFIEVKSPEMMKNKEILKGIRDELKLQMEAWAKKKRKKITGVRYWIQETADKDAETARYEIWIEAKMGKPVK